LWIWNLSAFDFPPTLRFGVFVIFDSATAASAALFLFPWLASISVHRKKVERKELRAASVGLFTAFPTPLCCVSRVLSEFCLGAGLNASNAGSEFWIQLWRGSFV
jgi:hypothetical protein